MTILKQNPLRDTSADKWCYQEPRDGNNSSAMWFFLLFIYSMPRYI